MSIPLAWLNLKHHRNRTAIAVAGVTVAVLIIFMELGFLGGTEETATLIYNELDFDIILLSKRYLDFNRSGTFAESALYKARSVTGVKEVVPLYVILAYWRNRESLWPTPDKASSTQSPSRASKAVQSRMPQSILVLGFPPSARVFRSDGKGIHEQVKEHQAALHVPRQVLIDTRSKPEFGSRDPGQRAELGPENVKVEGVFTMGTGFGSNGAVLVSDTTFFLTNPAYPRNKVSMGLVRLQDPDQAETVLEQIKPLLPPDVQALTREQIKEQERNFWIYNTSLGVIFGMGVAVAFGVGLLFVYQVIANDIAQRMGEFATLKALGYSLWYLYWVVLLQSFLMAVLGYIPGLLFSYVLYAGARWQTGIPLAMNLDRALFVLLLTVVMCGLSGFIAMQKVRRADPADLF